MTAAADHAELEHLVRTALAARVGPDLVQALDGSVPFHEVGIDSIDVVVALAGLEQADGRSELTQGDLWEVADCVDSMVRYLKERRG